MTDLEFFYEVIHTDKSEVPALNDHTAAQFLMKMASLQATISLDFDSNLCVIADTPLGRYTLMFTPGDDPTLIVDQVL